MRRPPFVWVGGRPYLDVTFSLPPRDDVPPLPELLAELLRHHQASDIVLLRPLSAAETKLLERAQRDRDVEAWAQLVVTRQDRIHARDRKAKP